MLLSANSGLHSARYKSLERWSILESIDFLHEMGFEAIDINLCASIYDGIKKPHESILDDDWKPKIAAVGERAAKYGMPLKLSHLPFFNYAEKNTLPDFDYYMEMTYRALEADAMLGVEWTVVHVSPCPQTTYNFVRPLCEYATPKGLGIAVENVPTVSTDILCETVDMLTSEGYLAGVCYDTGHANVGGLDQKETLVKLGKRIKMLHVHDNYGKDQHQAPFAGTIDWESVMRTLAEIGYTGDFNYEVSASKIPDECRANYVKYLVHLAKYLINIYNSAI